MTKLNKEYLMKAVSIIIVLLTLSLIFLAGCQSYATSGMTITDDLGRNVQLKEAPRRVVSLSPSNTEIVYALGLEDRLVGVTTYDNYPEAVKDKPRVSDYSTVDVEKVVSYKPDLILASSIQKNDAIPAFEKLGIAVLTIDPDTIDETFKDIELLGRISGKTGQAESLVTGLEDRFKAVTGKTDKLTASQRPRAFFLTWHDPLWTAGSGTVINELITKAGGDNIAADLKGHSQIELESVIQRNPQIIFVMSSMGDQDSSYNYIKSEPRFKATDAVKNSQVFKVDSDIFGRTTPRLVDGLETMARLIHPELFK
jgi:iron complex transport system substrate-binding protein